MSPYISEIFPNPPGSDRGHEWVELCASDHLVSLADYALRIGKRTLTLAGTLDPFACRIARTGTATIANRSADISLLQSGAVLQQVRTAGTAPEGFGFHLYNRDSFWATSTPGITSVAPSELPPIQNLNRASMLPSLLGTAACTAGILTVMALLALRYARDRYYALP